MISLKRTFLLLLFVGLNCAVLAQKDYLVNYTVDDGLPSSEVYSVIQDDYGYLWFSTDKGLSRFDGYTFQNFTRKDGLPNNVIFDFLKTSSGEIWCTTNSEELFKIIGQEPLFEMYEFNDTITKYAQNMVCNNIHVTDDGELFMGYHQSMGYLRISSEGELLALPKLNFHLAVETNVTRVVHKSDNNLSFFFFDKDHVFSAKANKLELDDIPFINCLSSSKMEATYLPSAQTSVIGNACALAIKHAGKTKIVEQDNPVISLGKSSDSTFWVGYNTGGLKLFDADGKLKHSYLEGESVTQVFIDHEGNYWATTLNSGVYRLKSPRVQNVQLRTENELRVSSMDSDGETLFIGLRSGEIHALKQGNHSDLYYAPVAPFSSIIWYDREEDNMYFGAKRVFSRDKPWSFNMATNILFRRDNYLVVGNKDINLFKDGVLSDTIFKSMRLKDALYFNGRIYGANIHGLHYVSFPEHKGNPVCVQDGIRIDDLNILGDWLVLGTNGDGVRILNKNHSIVHHLKVQDGLNSSFITRTFSENDSTLWLCTNKGINRVVFSGEKVYSLSTMNNSDGLSGNETWDLVVLNDTVWIGTQYGVDYIALGDFEALKYDKRNFYLRLSEVSLNDNPLSALRNSFSHDENKFTFHFSAISFQHAGRLVYRYTLKGVDEAWNYTTDRSVNYSALPPGDYQFLVQVKGENSRWEYNEQSFQFSIALPFWKTWWFIILCIVSGSGLIYLFFYYRILLYNGDILREILRAILKRLRREEQFVMIKHNGNEVKLRTAQIHYIKTDANYLEVHTEQQMYLIRSSISAFIKELPDAIEFLQVHRSYVVRLDKIQEKGSRSLQVMGVLIPVGRKFLPEIGKVQL